MSTTASGSATGASVAAIPENCPLDTPALLGLYERMLLIRRFELIAQDLLKKGEMPGFLHLYVGEEATAIGVCADLRAGRLDLQHASRSWACLGQGRASRARNGRTVRQGDRLLRRPWRQHAPVCQEPGPVRHKWLCGRRHTEHGGGGTQRPHARHRSVGRGVFRRRRGQPRGLPRIGQFRRRAESAGRLRLRKQSVRHRHSAHDGHGQHGSRHQGGRLRHSGRGRRRQRRAGRLGSDAHGGPASPPRRRPHPD